MLVVRANSVSDPILRDIVTIILRPSLASQAPRVSIIIARVEIFNIFAKKRVEGISRTIESIMPSRHNKDISKWVRWMIIDKTVRV